MRYSTRPPETGGPAKIRLPRRRSAGRPGVVQLGIVVGERLRIAPLLCPTGLVAAQHALELVLELLVLARPVRVAPAWQVSSLRLPVSGVPQQHADAVRQRQLVLDPHRRAHRDCAERDHLVGRMFADVRDALPAQVCVIDADRGRVAR